MRCGLTGLASVKKIMKKKKKNGKDYRFNEHRALLYLTTFVWEFGVVLADDVL